MGILPRRATQGVKMMSVDEGDRVTAVARMTAAKKKDGDSAEGEESVEAEGGEPADLPDGAVAEVPGDEGRVGIGSGDGALEDLLKE